jgi:hypothetical protein
LQVMKMDVEGAALSTLVVIMLSVMISSTPLWRPLPSCPEVIRKSATYKDVQGDGSTCRRVAELCSLQRTSVSCIG